METNSSRLNSYKNSTYSNSRLNSSSSNYDKVCDVETRILKSYGDTVRIEYEPTKMNEADNMASEYCVTNRNKVSTKNEVSCDGCCRATNQNANLSVRL